MNIPNFLDIKVIETEGENKGKFTESWRALMSNLFNELQINMSNESIVTPKQPTTNIALLEGANNQKYTGGLVYDETTDELKVSIYDAGTQTNTFKVVQVI